MGEDTENHSIIEMNQRNFASAEYAVIEPLYPTRGRVGPQPAGLARVLRIYSIQRWHGLADEALEDALYDSQALRVFVGIHLSRESVPMPPH
jgi:IS5 family transposase